MRFFQEYNGFIFEFNSIGDFFKALLWRLLGAVCGFILLGLVIFLLYLYGNQ